MTTMGNLADLRESYGRGELRESTLPEDPIRLFGNWMADAIESKMTDPNAIALATADSNGQPSVRIVLLKGFGPDGFVFYTNYSSRKARELADNPKASFCLHWPILERQIRVVGSVEKVSSAESDKYFQSRPYESQLSAAASPQSAAVSMDELLAMRERVKSLSAESGVQRPENWGGYRIIPEEIEFWQGRPNRLHDRIRYRKMDGTWVIARLAP